MKEWIYPNLNRPTPATTPFPYRVPGTPDSIPSYFYPREGTGLLLPIPPLPTYSDREQYERDKRYLTSLYPEFLLPLQRELLRRLEREHSETGFLFDRYPDRELLLRMVYEIYDALAENGDATLRFPDNSALQEDGMTGFDGGMMPGFDGDMIPGADGGMLAPPITIIFTKDPRNPWLLGLIQVLLSNEILARRYYRNRSRM